MTSSNTSLLQSEVQVDFSEYLDEFRRIQPPRQICRSSRNNAYPPMLDLLGSSPVNSVVDAYMKRSVLNKLHKRNEKRFRKEMNQCQVTAAAKTVFHAIAHEQSVYEVDVHPLILARLMVLKKYARLNRQKKSTT